jgi:hypothetical protein
MFCQCGGTGKGIKNKVGGELDISLQALFTYLCDVCAFECAISPLILLFSTKTTCKAIVCPMCVNNNLFSLRPKQNLYLKPNPNTIVAFATGIT